MYVFRVKVYLRRKDSVLNSDKELIDSYYKLAYRLLNE